MNRAGNEKIGLSEFLAYIARVEWKIYYNRWKMLPLFLIHCGSSFNIIPYGALSGLDYL